MIKILKASAGSGKTYHLAKTYIRILLQDEDPLAYRHVLAVTFTNKATDEMKTRILKELHLLSTDPASSPYFKDFVPSVFPQEAGLRAKASEVLLEILHDYGAFAVSTIDRFFQQTLKAFSREIGQFSSYQVELDKDSLVGESVDRILDSLTEDDKVLLKWLSDSMMEQLEQGRRYDLDEGLKGMAVRLKSDEHRSVMEEYGIDEEKAYTKDNLSRIRMIAKKVRATFLEETKAAARAVEDAFAKCGVSPAETSRGFLSSVLDKFAAADARSGVPSLSSSFLSKARDYGSWFKKADQAGYAPLEDDLLPPVLDLVSVYEEGIRAYNTARILLGQLSGLGIASDLYKAFRDLMKEKNVLSIDDSNMILKGIIDGSDAPFIYEKTGVRFEHFLLDEFQDTSRVQWDNFQPLIENSDREGFENLLVGDVKQSIYRWRGSDWKLMARDVAEQFPAAVEDSLDGNWRSLENIVGFNNDFFSYAATLLDRIYGSKAPISVSSIYEAGSKGQTVMSGEEGKGSVEAVFCVPDERDYRILVTVSKVLAAGARPRDIAILVRDKKSGSAVANLLMDNGFDVISNDSLRIKSSSVVRKLVSMMSSVKDPGDTIGAFLAKESGMETGNIAFNSLTDLCEQLIRIIKDNVDEKVFREETLYVQSFVDFVQDYAAVNGNSLDAFLKAWADANPDVSSPPDADAVRVMTIHKSKGLEFPYVIFPYAENLRLFKPERVWTVPQMEGTPLEDLGKVAFDVQLSSMSSNTLFEDNYLRERLLQYIDSINTFYVALTRASKGMTVISDAGVKPDQCFAGILLAYLKEKGYEAGFTEETSLSGGSVTFTKGSLYDFKGFHGKASGIVRREPGYPSFPLNPEGTDGEDGTERGRLKMSPDTAAFFTEEGRARMAARHNGTVLHDILSRVVVPSDLEGSVLAAVRDGSLEKERAEEVRTLLAERIAAHPDWFPSSGAEIYNETALIDTDGREWRPDRVIIKNGDVTVVDYKFGERHPGYRAQVRRYAGIYRRLGYIDVSTAVWYVPTDEVDES